MRRYIRPLALTALLLISGLSVPMHGTAHTGSHARKTAEFRERLITSVVEDGTGGSIIINVAGRTAMPPPAVRFYPGDNGESVMVADFAGVSWQQASRVFYPQAGAVRKVRLAQVQSRPSVFRLVLSAESQGVFKKVQFHSTPGRLAVAFPGKGANARKGFSAQPAETVAPTVSRYQRPAPQQLVQLPGSTAGVTATDKIGGNSFATGFKPARPNATSRSPGTAYQVQSAKTKLPPMPAGGLLLELKSDGHDSPTVAPQVVSAGALNTGDPNRPTLRGPIVVQDATQTRSADSVPPTAPAVLTRRMASGSVSTGSVGSSSSAALGVQSATATNHMQATHTSASRYAASKSAATRQGVELVEIVPAEEPPMLPGIAQVKKIVQITSAPKPAPAATGQTFVRNTSDSTTRDAGGMTKTPFPGPLARTAVGAETMMSPMATACPPPATAVLAGQRAGTDEDLKELPTLAPDIVPVGEIKIVSIEPLRLSVSAPGATLKIKSFRLHEPERHVIDIENAAYLGELTAPEMPENPYLKSVRLGSPDAVSGRIVLDLESEQTSVAEKVDAAGSMLVIAVAKEMPTAFNAPERLPPGNTIVLDAGHGGTDPGAQRGDIQEKEITLAIVEKLRKILRRQGAHVVMTRGDDTFVSLEERVKITNETAPRAFVSVHINSLESNDSISGIETYYLHPPSKALAASIHSALVKKLGAPDRSVRTARFYVVNHTPYPAVLAEVGFISNKEERDKLISFDYQQKVAEALAQGVIVYIAHHRPDEAVSVAAVHSGGTIATTKPSERAGKRFTQILHAKKPLRHARTAKISMARCRAKKSSRRIAIAHRSLRSKRTR
jgi:N-acetylmuramoyl-L-alanine amidase